MAKNKPIDPELLLRVENAIELAWERGCPVASNPSEIAPVAIRRWRSSPRRRIKQDDLDALIHDLAKGLIAAFEKRPDLVGPLQDDYQYLARQIASAIENMENFSDRA